MLEGRLAQVGYVDINNLEFICEKGMGDKPELIFCRFR